MNLTAKRLFFPLLVLTSGFFVHGQVFAQTDSEANATAFSLAVPANKNLVTGHSYYGFDIGVTGTDYLGAKNFVWPIQTNLTLGTYLPYDNLGTGVGFVGGVKAGVAFTPSLDVEWKLRYMTNYAAKQEVHPGIVLDPYYPLNIATGTDNYSLTTGNINLAMLGHYRLTDWLYAAGGLSMSGITGYNFSVSQHVSYDYIRLTTHTQSQVFDQNAGSSSVVNFFSSLRQDAEIGVGSVYRIGASNMLLDAELLASIPFTAWLTKAGDSSLQSTTTMWHLPPITDPHLWYISFTIGLRFPFEPLPPPPPVFHNPIAPNPAVHGTVELEPDTAGTTLLSGQVVDGQTGKPVAADISAVDLVTNKVVWTGRTDSNGNYRVRVHGPGKFSVTANKNGYLFGSAYFEVDSNGRILNNHSDIKLDSFAGGKTRLLVFFASDKADLQPSSTPELNRAADLMTTVSNLKVEIAGYSDTSGTYSHNKTLSLQRANAVRDYLISKGIAPDRVSATGYGSDSPIAPNDTEEGRAENRRVEFVVVAH